MKLKNYITTSIPHSTEHPKQCNKTRKRVRGTEITKKFQNRSYFQSTFFKKIYLFMYLFLAVLGLRFCARAFSNCGKWGPRLIGCAGLSLSRPLPLQSTGSRRTGSVILAHGPSRSAARGIFPDQGSNLSPLHWQADSQPLRHQGSPSQHF